jgi:hypothetical protein
MNRFSTFCLLGLIVSNCMIFTACGKKVSDEVIPADAPKLTGILSTLKIEHPRLLLTDARLQELKTLSLSDTRLKKYGSDVVALAEKDILKSPIQHILIGPRLLDKSRETLSRVYNLAFAYRWTGNNKYLTSAVSNIRTVCAFADWNPSHFLDVAEMTHAVAIGYDWLYNDISQATRNEIRTALILLGINEGKKAYMSGSWWINSEFNWNQVCNSGLLIGALAIAETDPDRALYILPKAIENLPYALKSYGPDGVWSEGPGYWSYATDYTAYGISALQSAMGNDFDLTKLPGMNVTGYFPIYSAGPSGYMLNYADAGEKSKLGAPHTAMWLANVYNNSHFSDFVIEQLDSRSADVFDVIWFRPYANSAAARAPDKFFDGRVALWFSRSSWSDRNGFWVGVKAGYNKVNHAHLDLGNFELDALGVRWARDLGSDDYNLPDYFGSLRYTYYRLNSLSHNVPVLGGKSQREDATSKFLKHSEGVNEPYSVIDFTEAYKDYVSSALRGLKVVGGRKALMIQDEFLLTKATAIAWGMTTDAAIQIINPKQAELTLSGQRLIAKILSPANAAFTSETAFQALPQKQNSGVNRLMAKIPDATGNVTITILLSPQWPGADNSLIPVVKALAQW